MIIFLFFYPLLSLEFMKISQLLVKKFGLLAIEDSNQFKQNLELLKTTF